MVEELVECEGYGDYRGVGEDHPARCVAAIAVGVCAAAHKSVAVFAFPNPNAGGVDFLEPNHASKRHKCVKDARFVYHNPLFVADDKAIAHIVSAAGYGARLDYFVLF